MSYCHVSQERLFELFRYEDGFLVRNTVISGASKINEPCVGKNKYGYSRVFIDGRSYFIHKLVFLYFNGYVPEVVDHINRDISDNRIENLRACNSQLNTYNASKRVDNTSGVKGVSWDKKNKKWKCYINAEGSRIDFGRFNSLELCELIVSEARDVLHKEFRCEG